MAKVFLHDQSRDITIENAQSGRLTVICSAGSVVRAVCEGSEYVVIADSLNKAVFNELHQGVWEITLDNPNHIVSKIVKITTEYEVVIDFFTGTIRIEYPEGSVCTCTNGVMSYTAPDTSGLWYCEVYDSGSWTITCTDGSDTKTKHVEVTHNTNYVDVIMSYFNATINVVYPIGASCICSNDDVSYAASDTTGNWSFNIYKAGEWTITASDGIQTITETVNISQNEQNENVTIKFFAATIDITYPESAICTCSDGITSFTAPDTSGRWIVTVPRTGTWTITSYKGNSNATHTVNITHDGQNVSILCEFFMAYINVLYPKDTFKTVLRSINEYGVKNDIAVDTSGTGGVRFYVEQIGSYEISIYRVSPYVGIESEAKDYSSTTVSITEDKQTVDITIAYVTVPEFTYSGSYELVDDYSNRIASTDGDWNIRFLTTGNLRFTKLNGAANGIDVFVVGGGGDGGEASLYSAHGNEYWSGGGGGGGGHCSTSFGQQVSLNIPYEIRVGGANGESSAFGTTASGGSDGGSANGGGEGGSGGRNGGKGSENARTADDGEDGAYAFLGEIGYLYGAGGGGGQGYNGEISQAGKGGNGGKDGGGHGGGDGAPNSGGGGGGQGRFKDYSGPRGNGGSGVVIIRNKRY